MSAALTAIRMRFNAGQVVSTQPALTGDLVGFAIKFPVAADIKCAIRIDETNVGYAICVNGTSTLMNITPAEDAKCFFLPIAIPAAGANVLLFSSVAAPTAVDCFALVRNN